MFGDVIASHLDTLVCMPSKSTVPEIVSGILSPVLRNQPLLNTAR